MAALQQGRVIQAIKKKEAMITLFGYNHRQQLYPQQRRVSQVLASRYMAMGTLIFDQLLLWDIL